MCVCVCLCLCLLINVVRRGSRRQNCRHNVMILQCVEASRAPPPPPRPSGARSTIAYTNSPDGARFYRNFRTRGMSLGVSNELREVEVSFWNETRRVKNHRRKMSKVVTAYSTRRITQFILYCILSTEKKKLVVHAWALTAAGYGSWVLPAVDIRLRSLNLRWQQCIMHRPNNNVRLYACLNVCCFRWNRLIPSKLIWINNCGYFIFNDYFP